MINNFSKIFILLFFCQLSNSAKSQTELDSLSESQHPTFISTRLGLNTLNQLNIHFNVPINARVGLSGSVGFNYGSRLFGGGNGLFCSASGPQETFNKTGILGGFGVSIPHISYKNKSQTHYIQLLYRNTVAKDIIIDEGCFSGSNTANMEEYDKFSQEIGMMYYLDYKNSGFYIGIGAGFGFYEKQFEPIMIFPGQLPREPEKVRNGFLVLDVGFNLGFFVN